MALCQPLEQPVRNYIDNLRKDGSPDVHRAQSAVVRDGRVQIGSRLENGLATMH